jgi:hypothetical protein
MAQARRLVVPQSTAIQSGVIAAPYCRSAGNKAEGMFWKLTGRRKRRIAIVPTDVAPKLVLAG